MKLNGLQLLLPLTRSSNKEVQRLAAHALANLSVNADNQVLMADRGGIEMLVDLLGSPHIQVQRQASKALANMGVNVRNKGLIAQANGIAPLIHLAESSSDITVTVEAMAALANLAVNDENEVWEGGGGGYGGAASFPTAPRSVWHSTVPSSERAPFPPVPLPCRRAAPPPPPHTQGGGAVRPH